MENTQIQSHSLTWSLPPAVLELEPHQVDIWRVCLDLPVDSMTGVAVLESTLSEDESQRAARFHFPTDRDRFIAAHGALRDILSRYLHLDPRQLSFSTNAYSKPS